MHRDLAKWFKLEWLTSIQFTSTSGRKLGRIVIVGSSLCTHFTGPRTTEKLLQSSSFDIGYKFYGINRNSEREREGRSVYTAKSSQQR